MFLLGHKIPHRRSSSSPLLGSQDISARERRAIGAGAWKFLTAAYQDVIKNAEAKPAVFSRIRLYANTTQLQTFAHT